MQKISLIRIIAVLVVLVFSVYFFVIDSFPNLAFFFYVIAASTFVLSFFSKSKLAQLFQKNQTELAMGCALFVIFLGLYLFRLTEITPGVWGDEVGLGWMVLQLQDLGRFTPFLEYNLGHPTPLIYLSSIAVAIFGRTVLALRLVSVIFGALCVPAFYFLLRKWFDKIFSLSGAVLLGSSYVLIIVSRFAYEMSAAIFFTILSGWALARFSKKPSGRNIILVGLLLAAGLYTYLAFRIVLIPLLFTALVLIWQQKKHRFSLLKWLAVSFLIAALPLIIYSIRHPDAVNQRVASLSIFHQGLPREEVFKELGGATRRTLGMFFTTGDPNLRQNPSGTTPIDPITSVLFALGVGYLLRRKTGLGIVVVSSVLLVLASEIITLEQIPEGHYYGLGHPNTLRISAAIPFIVFCVIWALRFIEQQLAKIFSQSTLRMMILETIVLLIAVISIYRYFAQPAQPWTHYTNYVVHMEVIDSLNTEKPPAVMLSSDFFRAEHFRYFVDPAVEMSEFSSPVDCSFSGLSEEVYILSLHDVRHCAQTDFEQLLQFENYTTTLVTNQWNGLDGIVIRKK